MSQPFYIDALVRFVLEVHDDEQAADEQADNLTDRMVQALEPVVVAAGGYEGSVTVIDWTQRTEAEVLAE